MSSHELTVAVATCGRPAGLERCLAGLAEGVVAPGEVIVVDQDPSREARAVVEACGIEQRHYIEQVRLGLSASRNLALASASGSLLAVTDDDCMPDRGWVQAILAAFARAPTPAAVTGPVLPLGPQPPGTHAISLRPISTTVDARGQILPWRVGSGGNFAAPRALLRDHGGWDTRLGTGSPGKAAEDAELLYRLLRAGGVVRYEPDAVVRHEWQTWERRLATRYSYAYGVGAMCGMWLRRGDRFAMRMFLTYANDHARALARAARAHDRGTVNEHARGVGGLLPGLLYGLQA